jgi:hypothetical protein
LNNFQKTAPTLRWRPDFVHGMPVARDTRRLAFVMPSWRFQLHPPRFINPIMDAFSASRGRLIPCPAAMGSLIKKRRKRMRKKKHKKLLKKTRWQRRQQGK